MALVNCYTTLAKAKRRLRVGDQADDTTLEEIITTVSRLIDNECGQHFYASTETRVYSPTNLFTLLVDELLTVTSLKTDEDADRVYEITWASTDYDLLPTNAPYATPPGPYWEIRVRPNGSYRFPYWWPLTVQIVGTWGASAATPAVVEDMCLQQVALLFRGGTTAPFGVTGGGEVAQEVRAVGLHPFVKRGLAPYVRVHAG